MFAENGATVVVFDQSLANGAAVDLTVAGSAGEGLTIEVRNRLPVGVGVGVAAIPGAGTGGDMQAIETLGRRERLYLSDQGGAGTGPFGLWIDEQGPDLLFLEIEDREADGCRRVPPPSPPRVRRDKDGRMLR